MFNENTDGFDVFEDSSVGDFSAYTNAEIQPRTALKRHRVSTVHSNSNSNSNSSSSSDDQNQPGFMTTRDADREMADNMQDHDMDTNDTSHQNKKPRSYSPMPTVTDSFESELVREIDSAADLLTPEAANEERFLVPHKVCVPWCITN